MRFLHIAPFNTSGVPITFVRAERRLGYDSRLITLGRDRRGYEEDICLDLPFIDFAGTRMLKQVVSHPDKLRVNNIRKTPEQIPITWQPNGVAEAAFIRLRELLWGPRIRAVLDEVSFWDFDVYQLDGGLEFYRDGRLVRRLKERGKKIICCYTGSDLRTRGVIRAIDELADLNITLEYDHLQLHPNLHHVLFPFETGRYQVARKDAGKAVVIGHAPTNREAKGSGRIIAAVEALKRDLPVELVLIENMTHEQSLAAKARCDIFVDQIGDLGYGLNSLESLSMGIATCSCLVERFAVTHPDHPFVVIDEDNIESVLRRLVLDRTTRKDAGARGRAWVVENHDSISIVREIHRLLGLDIFQTSDLETVSHKTG